MKPPCDEALLKSKPAVIPCSAEARPWVLVAAIGGSSMAFIDGTVVNVALPALQTDLGATVVDVQWVVEAYGLFLGALLLVGGSAGDLFGRRRMFLAGVAGFAIASACCGLAGTLHQLVIARAAQGVGAAFMVPGSLSIVSAFFAEKDRGRAIGTWSGFTTITTALGPVLGGWLIEHASWRWVFFINIPLAAVVIMVSLRHVPESRSADTHRIDWVGALLAALGLAGLVTGFIEAARFGWSGPAVLGSLSIGLSCFLLFSVVEANSNSPMIPMSLFKSTAFSGANLLTFFLYSALGIFFFLFPLNLIQVQRYSATAAGAAALPLILLMFVLSPWSGELVSKYGPRLPLIIGPLIAAAGFLLFAMPSLGGSYWVTFFPGFVVLGIGVAVSVAPLTTVVMGSVNQDTAGTASGINNAVARIAGLLAIAALGLAMMGAFRFHLNRSLESLAVPPGTTTEIQSNAIRLAAIEIPAGLDSGTKIALQTAVNQAFVFGFRLAMLICVALSMTSALFAWWMMPAKLTPLC
jgi:EmrB/QacA subfamily drug resistance transporter